MNPIFSKILAFKTLSWLGAGLLALGLAGAASAQGTIDPKASPNDFIQAVGDNILNVLKHDPTVKRADLTHINELVNQHVLPYVDLEKTTRLAAGRYWRQASPEQQQNLVQAFKGTLIRTYSGALANFDPSSTLRIEPFRGDPKADDAVVRSILSRSNAPSVGIDYRLERTPQGWKIYDLNVEGIWLIQSYRNQFADQISRNGIDGLIKALNQQNK